MDLGFLWTTNLRPFMTELDIIAGYSFDDSMYRITEDRDVLEAHFAPGGSPAP